jgi:hypothetical protein
MDDRQPENSRLKIAIIAGSIAAVVVGLMVVGLLYYRSRVLIPPPSSPATPGISASPGPTTSASGGLSSPPGSQTPPVAATPQSQGIANVPSAPPDFTNGLDSDKDGLTDPEEAAYGTDPHKADTDGDGYTDYQEVRVYGTNALDPKSNPKTVQGLYSPDKGKP